MIYKYNVSHNGTTLALPQDSKIVYVGTQECEVYVWVELGSGPLTNIELEIVGTGWETRGTYVGTTQVGSFVWHVYRV